MDYGYRSPQGQIWSCDSQETAQETVAEAPHMEIVTREPGASWTVLPPATRRAYWTANGPTDAGTILEEGHFLPNGDSHPDGALFFHIAFDDGFTDWCHHSLITLA